MEMFGDERGGGTNVRYGLKPMKNSEAQQQYYQEIEKLVRDLNLRYLRARAESLSSSDAEAALDRILAGESVEGVHREDLLQLPHPDYFRRRGVPAFRMIGWGGETWTDLPAYLQHLVQTLPEAYRASRDFMDYVQGLTDVAEGRSTHEQAAGRMPSLRRMAGACPCSKSVRWVADEAQPATLTA